MTPTNATAVQEMMTEIGIMLDGENHDNQLEMLEAIRSGCVRKIDEIIYADEDPAETAHEKAIARAEDKFKVRRENI